MCKRGGDGLALVYLVRDSGMLVRKGGLVGMSVIVLTSLVLLLGCSLVGLLASGDFKHSKPRRALLLSGIVGAIGVGTGIALLVFC